MGKTHLTGLEIGDRGLDIWSSPSLNHKVKLVALNTQVKLHTQEGGHITEIRVANGAGALVVATINIGTGTSGGARSNILSAGVTTAGAALTVEKYVPLGFYYVEATNVAAPGVPVFVIISFIAALNA